MLYSSRTVENLWKLVFFLHYVWVPTAEFRLLGMAVKYIYP